MNYKLVINKEYDNGVIREVVASNGSGSLFTAVGTSLSGWWYGSESGLILVSFLTPFASAYTFHLRGSVDTTYVGEKFGISPDNIGDLHGASSVVALLTDIDYFLHKGERIYV